MLVIYHGGCFDGFTAAWTYWQFAEKPEHPAVYYGARYGDHPPWRLVETNEEKDDGEILVVDFSYPRPLLDELRKHAKSLTILDHHKTALEALRGFDGAFFDMAHAGCVLLWEYLCARDKALQFRELPNLLRYVEDRDLWTFAIPGSREVSAVVASTEMDFPSWTRLHEALEEDEAAVLEQGAAILRYMRQYGTKALAEAKPEIIGGYTVPCVNLPYMNCSEYVGRLLTESGPTVPFAAGFFRRGDGVWQFSLRSRPGFDCSVVAQMYGGGGHPQAAGFQVHRLPWEDPGTTTDGGERRFP